MENCDREHETIPSLLCKENNLSIDLHAQLDSQFPSGTEHFQEESAELSGDVQYYTAETEDEFVADFSPKLHSTILEDSNEPTEGTYDIGLQGLCNAIMISESQSVRHSEDIEANSVQKEVTGSLASVCQVTEATFHDQADRRKIRQLKGLISTQNRTIQSLRSQLREKDVQIRVLQKNNDTATKKKDQEIVILNKSLESLRKSCSDLSSVPEQYVQQRVRSAFLKIFTANQVDLILGLKKKVVWTAEEIAMAFSLRYHSQPAYEIVRTDFKIPLPSLRSLREWASCMQMRRGALNDVFTVINIAGKHMTPRERVVVLAFDEVSVNGTIEHDKRNDDIVGPHKEMQVVSARGLFAKWKQPVFADFDKKMTTHILNDIISRFHAIGFNVVAIVHDCGGGNLGLWRELGIDHSIGKTSMNHPVTQNEIYFFPDVPHLLKLIRNWLLDGGFLYKGKRITNKFLKALIEKASTIKKPLAKEAAETRNVELNSMFKLTLKHITVRGAERQNVRLAAELLSHTTAVNLRRHFGHEEEAQLLAEFIDTVNDWFDVMNSYQIYQNIVAKKCYGMEENIQNEILDRMSSLMQNIRTLSNHSLPAASHLQIFQKAVLTSILSTKKLLIQMRADYGITFIMTYKLNQDFLENLFAILRLKGGTHDHPSPLQALDRLRLVILGKSLNHQIKRNQNAQNDPVNEDYMMIRVFRKTKNVLAKEKEINTGDCSDDEDLEPWTYVSKERSLEEADGAQYAFGYMAREFIKEFPEMGSHTYELEDDTGVGVNKENYVEDLSYGGLVQPSNEWSDVYDRLDSVFNWMHNTGENADEAAFRNPTQVKQRTYRELKKRFPDIPERVIKSFVTKRINIRVKHMRKQLNECKVHKHKIIKKTKSKVLQEANNIDNRCTVTGKNAKKLKHQIN